MKLFNKLPPVLSARLLNIYVSIGIVWNLLTGTIWGAFFLSVILYFMMFTMSSFKPLTPMQLFIWLSNLPVEYKLSVLSSFLTIIGFLIAFHIATINWKQQMHGQLRVSTAGEIENIFSEISRLIVNARIYAESLVNTINNIQDDGATNKNVFSVQYILEKTPEFLATRDRLSFLSIEIHRIFGKNSVVLSSLWGAMDNLDHANDAFTKISRAMWIRVPYIHQDDPDIVNLFIAQVNVNECLDFINCCETNCDFINGMTGYIRGQLLSTVIDFNLSSLINLLTKRSHVEQFFKEMHRNRKEDI